MNRTHRCRMDVAPALWIREFTSTNSLRLAMRVGTAVGEVSAEFIGDVATVMPHRRLAISEVARTLSMSSNLPDLARCHIQLI